MPSVKWCRAREESLGSQNGCIDEHNEKKCKL